jgi:hypothetical protein
MGLTTDRMERGRKNWSNHGNVNMRGKRQRAGDNTQIIEITSK